MVSLAQVVYPGLFPLSPGDTLAASEASQKPSVRLEEASKDKLYTVGWFTLQFFISSQIFIISQPWSTQMRHPGKTLALPSGSTG